MDTQHPSGRRRAVPATPRTATRSGVTHVKIPQSYGFSVIDNGLIQNARLSFLARALSAYIQSLPEGSCISIRALAAESPEEGEVRIAAALRELEEHGYLDRIRVRLPNGRVVTQTISYNCPAAREAARQACGEPAPAPAPAPAPEPEPEPEPELAQDPGRDWDLDRGPGRDWGLDRGPGPDWEPHADPDPGRDWEPHADPDPGRDWEPHADPDPGPCWELDADPDPGPNWEPDPDPGPPSGGGAPAPVHPPAPAPAPAPVPVLVPVGVRKAAPPPEPPAGPAAELLLGLRAHEPRLTLSVRDVHRLAPGVDAWFARGCKPDAVRRALTADLPVPLRHPAGLLAHRLTALLPPPLPARPPAPDPLQNCEVCDHAFRAPAPGVCGGCRPPTQERAA
ncbi:hypothetical protein [Streptomyces sp. NPDC101115]|uniref:hypothetical protein n=1 Tax=Streptomyces sp. NPDC101115 TaxID=3366106 RepID=UPI0038255789